MLTAGLTDKEKRWNAFVEMVCMKDLETLSPTQKRAALCCRYDMEMENGGHSSFFDCCPDIDHNELIEAINTIAYPAIADNFLKALYEDETNDWVNTDAAYYNFEPSLSACLMRYVEENKDIIF